MGLWQAMGLWPESGLGRATVRLCRQVRLRSAGQFGEDFLGVPVGAHVVPSPDDPAIAADEHRRPYHADALAAVKRLLTPRSVRLHDFVGRIAEQAHAQPVFLPKLTV
jgi:hypothetical protein